MDFNQNSGANTPMDLIPRGFLCWVKVTFRGMKTSPTTGSRYADLELTVSEGQPYTRKKIFTRVADPEFAENSEKYRQMGMSSMTRMVEAAQLVQLDDDASYKKLNTLNCEGVMLLLDGKFVAIKVKIEPGQQGYEDKNDVGDYLTPNPKSQSYKNYLKLLNGDHGLGGGGPTGAPATPRPSGFGSGGTQAQVPVTPPNNPTAQAPAQRGFNPNVAPSFLKPNP